MIEAADTLVSWCFRHRRGRLRACLVAFLEGRGRGEPEQLIKMAATGDAYGMRRPSRHGDTCETNNALDLSRPSGLSERRV
jgi:hypothetical protein